MFPVSRPLPKGHRGQKIAAGEPTARSFAGKQAARMAVLVRI